MPNIPVMSFNVFSAMSERYWTGYPTSENPYTDPVNNWANSRSIFTQIKPVGQLTVIGSDSGCPAPAGHAYARCRSIGIGGR